MKCYKRTYNSTDTKYTHDTKQTMTEQWMKDMGYIYDNLVHKREKTNYKNLK